MAIRTTSDAVGEIIELTDGIEATPFIEVASSLVDRHCATAKDSDDNDYYTSAELELIERWLSAHFYAIRENRAASEGAGPVQETKQYKVGFYFTNTMYGQQALMLDSYGGLQTLQANSMSGKTVRPGITWLGKTEC